LNHLKLSRWQADATLLLITLIWGWTFVVMKDSIAQVPVFSFLTVRFTLALLTLAPFLWWSRSRAGLAPKGGVSPTLGLIWPKIRGGIITGLFLFAGYAFQTVGLQYTTVAKSGFITGLYVVLVPVLSTVVLRRAPTRAAVLGLGVATVGLARLSLGPDLSMSLGDFLTLLGALAYAGHVTSVARFGAKTDVLVFSAIQISTVLLGSIVASFIMQGGIVLNTFNTQVLMAALATGVLATALVLVLQATAQRFTTPTQTAVIFTMESVFAVMFGCLLAGDQLGPAALLGGSLIVVGMLTAEVGESLLASLTPHSRAGLGE
jgi:drug/metabolite transporter (DMT)-like permease